MCAEAEHIKAIMPTVQMWRKDKYFLLIRMRLALPCEFACAALPQMTASGWLGVALCPSFLIGVAGQCEMRKVAIVIYASRLYEQYSLSTLLIFYFIRYPDRITLNQRENVLTYTRLRSAQPIAHNHLAMLWLSWSPGIVSALVINHELPYRIAMIYLPHRSVE